MAPTTINARFCVIVCTEHTYKKEYSFNPFAPFKKMNEAEFFLLQHSLF